MFNDFCHGNDRICLKSIEIVYFIKCAFHTALADFHTVKRYHQTDDFNICCTFYLRNGFFHGLTGCGNILDHDNTITVFQLASKETSLICTMILFFFTVRTITNFFSVQFAECDCSYNAERNTLICRSEEYVKIITIFCVDCFCIIFAKFF